MVAGPSGSGEGEQGDRGGREREPGSENNTLGRGSDNITLNSRTVQNTTEEENGKIEQTMAENTSKLTSWNSRLALANYTL